MFVFSLVQAVFGKTWKTAEREAWRSCCCPWGNCLSRLFLSFTTECSTVQDFALNSGFHRGTTVICSIAKKKKTECLMHLRIWIRENILTEYSQFSDKTSQMSSENVKQCFTLSTLRRRETALHDCVFVLYRVLELIRFLNTDTDISNRLLAYRWSKNCCRTIHYQNVSCGFCVFISHSNVFKSCW